MSTAESDPAGTRAARGAPQLGGDGLHPGGVLANGEAGERVHRGLECRGEGAAEEGQAPPDEALVGPQLKGDERPCVPGGRQADDEGGCRPACSARAWWRE